MRTRGALVLAFALAGCPDLSGFSGGADGPDGGGGPDATPGDGAIAEGGGTDGASGDAGADADADAGSSVVFEDHFDDRTTPQGAWDSFGGMLTIEAASDAPSSPNVPLDTSKLKIELGVHTPRAATQDVFFDDLVCTAE